jgi:hypothetical protein
MSSLTTVGTIHAGVAIVSFACIIVGVLDAYMIHQWER